MRGFFVTGTDTNVGKTIVAASLAVWAREAFGSAAVMKPVATGAMWDRRERRWLSEDAALLRAASGCDAPWDWITPALYREPLAPLTAAVRERRPVRLKPIEAAFKRLSGRYPCIIVEGIGGLLVPLTPRSTVADLARSLGLPLIIVARTSLGTLNHTLLTIACARAAGLRIAGVICTNPEPPRANRMARLARQSNPKWIRELGRVPLLGVLPHLPACGSSQLGKRVLACRKLMRHLDTQQLTNS